MAYFERIRDVVSGPFSSEIMRQRNAAGWQLVSLEWRREVPGDAPVGQRGVRRGDPLWAAHFR